MSKGFFVDKSNRPDSAAINNFIGKARQNWDLMLHHLGEGLKLKGEFKFYGINYGWALRFKKSGKSIIALYPGKDDFMVQIILNKNQVETALEQVKNSDFLKVIYDTKNIKEGKWIYLLIDETSDLDDVFTMITIRTKIK
ncbi:MAG: DUF3788 family protein [Bacteroidota bacterium]|nr:DUF3788 family protein [Bacteroidota bacterium]MDP4274067.1 DUF3788 family protein [Bacteroidota bacterium]